MAGIELPDWLHGVALLGKSGAAYLPVATDASGQLYIVLTGSPDVTIPGNVNVNDLNTLKQIQGTDGTIFRTARLDANGQFIIVPRGASGNYMAVDANGFLTAVLKALGADAALHTLASDNNGQLIMVPRGSTGNYMAVDASGFLSAKMVALGQDAAQHEVVVDPAGQIVMVPRGQSGNYMNVDASGFLTAILKGLGSSGLQTVAVDTSGRMIGLLPDVGGGWNTDTYIGLAELAARLGGLQRWDNRGQMLHGLDFANGIPAYCSIQVNGSNTITIKPNYGYNGTYAADFHTTAGAGGIAGLSFGIAPTQSTKVGLEITFFGSVQNGLLELYYMILDGANEKDLGIRWHLDTGAFQYFGSDSAWHTVTGANVPFNMYTGLTSLKMVANYTTNKYMRMLVNNALYDLSAYSFFSGANTLQPQLLPRITLYSVVGQAVDIYLDDVVVTHNEPA